MIRLTLAMAALALAGLLAISVAPAAAEFTANNESTEGSADFQISVEGVGTPINCGEAETKTGQLAWQIKKEGKAAKSGPELALKFKSWGVCGVEYEEKESTLSGGECTWETKEPGSEREVTDKIASGCKLKGEIGGKSCEVTIESKSNEKLSNLTLVDSGENNENLSVDIALKSVTVGASGAGCEAAGIESSSTAELTGGIEALEISPGLAAARFELSYGMAGNQIWGINNTTTVTVTNKGTTAGKPGNEPGNALFLAGLSAFFEVSNQKLATCQTTLLLVNQQCTMTVKLTQPTIGSVRLRFQIFEGNNLTDEQSVFGASRVG